MDLLLNINGDRDLAFQNGACPTTGDDLAYIVAQRLFIMLRTFQGEWFMETSYGIPYLQSILGKKITKSGVDTILQSKILDEAGVSRISEWSSILDNRSRSYSVRFKVIATNGVESQTIEI